LISCNAEFTQPLKFREDGTFRIVQFTDLHYGDPNPQVDQNSSMVQMTVLQAELPDLVIMTGDSVSGWEWDGTSGWFAKNWERITAPMIKMGIPWAFAIGNHDDGADLNRTQIVKLDQTYPLSRTQHGPSNIHGATNYYLPVESSNGTSAATNLWFFDSGYNNCLGITGWDCVHSDQVQWYMDASSKIQQSNGGIIPGLAFFHIPFPEFMNVWNYETCYGRLEDSGVCCFSVNTGLYAAMKTMGDIVSVHCGHDHDNDYFGDYYDITLAYGRKTGYGAYGPPAGWLRGARVIEITENPFSIAMWIRQEDGSKVSQPFHVPGSPQFFLCCDALGSEKTEEGVRTFRSSHKY